MAREFGTPEQAVVFARRVPEEKRKGWKGPEMGMGLRAVEVADEVAKIAGSAPDSSARRSAQTAIKNIFWESLRVHSGIGVVVTEKDAPNGKGGTRKVNEAEVGGQKIRNVTDIEKALKSKQLTPEQATALQALQEDMVDGACVGALWGLNDGESARILELEGSERRREAMLEVLGGNGVLRGVEGYVVDSIVADKGIRETLRLVNIERKKGPKQYTEALVAATLVLVQALEKGTIDSYEGDMVLAYLSGLQQPIDDAARATGRPEDVPRVSLDEVTDPGLQAMLRKFEVLVASRGLARALDVYSEKLAEGMDNFPEGQVHAVAAYFGELSRRLKEEEVAVRAREAEAASRGGGEAREGMSESTYDTFVNAEFIQQPIQVQLDTFPPSWFKRPPERFLDKPDHHSISDWQQMIRARVNLTNASYIKAKVASLRGEEAKDNQFLLLSERELSLIYHEPGVRESMERVMTDFFKKDDSEPKAFFLALREGNVGEEEWKDVLASFRQYQEGLVRELIDRDGMTEVDAKAAVAMAWNFLYVCNVFESADNNRDIGGNCGNVFGEQIRAMMHPLSKAKRKFGVQPDLDENSRAQGTEEGWGGFVGGWFADMVSWDDTRRVFVQGLQDGSMVPFPKRIGASMIELLKVETVGKGGRQGATTRRTTMSMAQALLEGKEIELGDTDSNLFGDYGDKWDTFYKLYEYAAGKTPLELKKFAEWTGALPDILAKVRGIKVIGGKEMAFADLDSANTLAWIIANSVGVMRSTRLMISMPGDFDYEAFVDTILQSPRLVMNNEKRKEVKRLLHAGFLQGPTRMSIGLEAAQRNSRRPQN